jgi:opacity protein-like surface antigen
MRRMVMAAALGAVALAAAPRPAAAAGLDLRAGAFFPRVDSNIWDDTEELFGTQKDDWIGFTGGIEYSFRVARQLELGFHVDYYGRTLDTFYVDFTRPNGQDIFQTLEIDTVPTGATLRFVVNPSRGAVTPYIGVGADAVFYEYKQYGDFIDFFDDDLPVRSDFFVDEGTAFGFHVTAGVRIPMGDDFSLVAEGKYLWAKTDMGEDFRLNEIDLSGPSATLGINLRF